MLPPLTNSLKGMANFCVIGLIDTIKYLPERKGCLVFVSEYKQGYKKSNGEIVDGKYLQWKCIFNHSYLKYISEHYNTGMLVEVKGEVLPYAKEHDTLIEGYSVIGQTMNKYAYPRASAKMERKMIRETTMRADEKPSLQEYMSDDF